MAGFQAQVEAAEAQPAQVGQLVVGERGDVGAGGVRTHPPHPGQPLADAAEQPAQLFEGQGQGVAVGQEQGLLAAAPGGGKVQIRLDARCRLDGEFPVAVGAAEGAAVVGTAGGDLEENGKGFAGRPDDVALVIHGQHGLPAAGEAAGRGDQPFFLAKSAMNPTSRSTPSRGKAL